MKYEILIDRRGKNFFAEITLNETKFRSPYTGSFITSVKGLVELVHECTGIYLMHQEMIIYITQNKFPLGSGEWKKETNVVRHPKQFKNENNHTTAKED